MFSLTETKTSSADLMSRTDRDFTSIQVITSFDEYTSFNTPSSFAINNKSRTMCVVDTGEVYLMNTQGLLLERISEKTGVKSPAGIAITNDGRIYISDTGTGSVKVISSDATQKTIELPAVEGGKAPIPGRMTIDRNGNLYVIDRANQRICVFDKDSKLKFQFGKIGAKHGEFKSLEDVAVDRLGRIYAIDSSGTPVQVFDKKGKYLYRFGFKGEGDEDISFAAGLFIDPNDQVWVVDQGAHCLKVFDRNGAFLRRFGEYGTEQGALFQPVDADIDSLGRVYVLEAGAKRLQVFMLRRSFERFTQDGL
ncbi:MAG: NHL repeat-containing protein [Armatimonadota bacterium]